MKLIDKISQSSKSVYEDYLITAQQFGLSSSANPDEAVSCVIIGNKCNIEEIEIVSGFIAQQSAEITRLRKAIEEAIKMMPHRIPFCDTNMGGECDCTCKLLLDHLSNALEVK